MNAAPPVFQAPPLSDAVQPDAPASAASANMRAAGQDFAAALSDAGGKPARKSAANKHQGPASSGSPLPAPGNQPPVTLNPPPPAKTASFAATPAPAPADAAATVKAAQGSAQGSVPGAITAASTAPASASAATIILSLPNPEPAAAPAPTALPGAAASPGSAASPGLTATPSPATGADATTAPSANGPSAAGSGLSLPHPAGLRTLATAETSTAGTVAAKPSDAIAKPATTAAANAAPSSGNAPGDSTLSNAPAAAGTDAAAQALMAAAITQGASAPRADSAATDDLSTSDTDLPPGAAAVSGPATGAAAAALAQQSAAAISAAVTAATAASVAQAVSAAASASATDKRSHGNGPEPTLAGASNDGSAGAAQLLTSNTASDSAPTPTFKVAAGVDTAQFGQGVADRVSLMMDGNVTSAKLQVNPPALGPIEVRIALQGGHAQVSFLSHSAVTRDALESSSAKLREMLGSQGFSSVSVDISQRSFQERSPQSQAYETAPSIGGDAPIVAAASLSRSASGLLDAYA